MKAHELAARLLKQPNLPLSLELAGDDSASITKVKLKPTSGNLSISFPGVNIRWDFR